MAEDSEKYKTSDYVKRRKKLSGVFFEVALPNEYLVPMGQKRVKPILGGKRFRLFRKFLRVPASVETLYFKTDNANMHYQGIGIEGYASWRIDPARPEVATKPHASPPRLIELLPRSCVSSLVLSSLVGPTSGHRRRFSRSEDPFLDLTAAALRFGRPHGSQPRQITHGFQACMAASTLENPAGAAAFEGVQDRLDAGAKRLGDAPAHVDHSRSLQQSTL